MFQGPETADSGQPVTVSVSLTNPLPVPLTGCRFLMEGNLEVAEDDKNTLESFFWAHTLSYRSVLSVTPPPIFSFHRLVRWVEDNS